MNLEQLATLNRYEIPAHIDAIDAGLTEGMTEAQIADLEYQFRVVYALDAVTKSRAHFQFVLPESAEGKDIRNVLVQHKLADHLYPHKPGEVVSQVHQNTGKAKVLVARYPANPRSRVRFRRPLGLKREGRAGTGRAAGCPRGRSAAWRTITGLSRIREALAFRRGYVYSATDPARRSCAAHGGHPDVVQTEQNHRR